MTWGFEMMKSNNDAGPSFASTHRAAPVHLIRLRQLVAGFALTGLLAWGVVSAATVHPQGSASDDTYSPIDLGHFHALFGHLLAQASPEQKASFETLRKSADGELETLNQLALAAHRRKIDLLLQDSVDQKALVRASAEELEAANRLAQRIDAALEDLAELLTPAQRAQLRNHVAGRNG